MDIMYAKEKIHLGLVAMNTNTGSIQSRLFEGFKEFHRIAKWVFPDEDMQAIWTSVVDRFTRVKDLTPVDSPNRKGDALLTLESMTNQEAIKISKALHELDARIDDYISLTER